MSTRRKVLAFAMASTTAFLLGSVPAALADGASPGATAEIMVIHATQIAGPGSIDPAIGVMPQLQKPPFSAYNTYKLVDRKSLPLVKDSGSTYLMVNGRTLLVTLLDMTADRRFHVSAAINQPENKQAADTKKKPAFLKLLEVTAAPNEPFFVGGQTYQGGSLVLAITIKP